jgi:hypothetical protein
MKTHSGLHFATGGSACRSSIGLLIASHLLASVVCSVAQADMDIARDVSIRAEKMALGGNNRGALSIVTNELSSLRSLSAPAAAQLEFTGAWLYRRLAGESKEDRAKLLVLSSNYYWRVLSNYPTHLQASENLSRVLREMGQPQEALRLLERIPNTNAAPSKAYSRLLAIADLTAQVNGAQPALAFYQQAFALNQQDERAPLRIIALYPQLPGWNQAALFNQCTQFANAGLPHVASRGYEQLISQEPSTNAPVPPLVERAIESWVETEAGLNALSPDSLSRFSTQLVQRTASLSELKSVIVQTTVTSQLLPYWGKSSVRRHIFTSALRSLASHKRLVQQPGEAQRFLDLSQDFAPEIYTYRGELQGRPLVGLDAALDLAALYQSFPALDQEGQKFERLQSRLIDGKNTAYLDSDLTAMEKYHTVLGLIFAERGRWTGGGMYAAPYHLENAVKTAQRVTGRKPSEYKPLPHLTRRLADGLVTNSQSNLPKATQLYVDAAHGYLDDGDFAAAELMLSNVGSLTNRAGTPAPPGYGALGALLTTLKKVYSVNASDVTAPGPDALRAFGNVWTESPITNVLDPLFLQRQRVRALEHLSTKAFSAGLPAESLRFHDQAIQEIQAARGSTHDDLRRLSQNPVRSMDKIKVGNTVTGPRAGQRLIDDDYRKRLGALNTMRKDL